MGVFVHAIISTPWIYNTRVVNGNSNSVDQSAMAVTKWSLLVGNGSSLILEKISLCGNSRCKVIHDLASWTLQCLHYQPAIICFGTLVCYHVWCLCLSIGTSVIIFVLLVLLWQRNNREISSQCIAYYSLLWLYLLRDATPMEVKRLLLGKLQNITMWCTASFFQLRRWPSFIRITTFVGLVST